MLTKIGGFFRIYHDDKKCAFSEKCVLNKADREGGWNNFFKYAAYLICELFFLQSLLIEKQKLDAPQARKNVAKNIIVQGGHTPRIIGKKK